MKTISVKLLGTTNIDPKELAAYMAKRCYGAEIPKLGDMIDLESTTFNPGHHSVFEHYYLNYDIEGIPVGLVTFWLHTHPFYNTSQRSGRFCRDMFKGSDAEEILNMIKEFYPKLENDNLNNIKNYLELCFRIFNSSLTNAKDLVKEIFLQERPHANEEYIKKNAPKFAREQIRAFLPVIFPSGLGFTIDIITLASIYRSAPNEIARQITQEMANLLLEKAPDLEYLFQRENEEYSIMMPDVCSIAENPSIVINGITNALLAVRPEKKDITPVDLLHFKQKYMQNNVARIDTTVSLSLIGLGQKQRHRTVSRSDPKFTGSFYLPPIAKNLGLKNSGLKIMNEWIRVGKNLPPFLAMILAPYGAMVSYAENSSLNATIHEVLKRSCFCTQEEMYQLAIQLINQLKESPLNHIVDIFSPHCHGNGSCIEGDRYCGKNIRDKSFPKRTF